MKSPHRKIRTRSPLPTPNGFDREAIERWVRKWTKRHIDLEHFEFGSLDGAADEGFLQQRRERLMKFARALQRELLLFENWDGTARG